MRREQIKLNETLQAQIAALQAQLSQQQQQKGTQTQTQTAQTPARALSKDKETSTSASGKGRTPAKASASEKGMVDASTGELVCCACVCGLLLVVHSQVLATFCFVECSICFWYGAAPL